MEYKNNHSNPRLQSWGIKNKLDQHEFDFNPKSWDNMEGSPRRPQRGEQDFK